MANTSRFPINPKDQNQGNSGQNQGDLKTKIQDTASSVAHKAQDMASDLGHKAQDVASNVGHKAQDMASNVGHKAQDLAASARDRTDDAISTVGERMSSIAGTIRDKAPREGVLGSAASSVADKLQSGGDYLQQHGLGDMANDMTTLVKQHPMQALLAGFGVGFLLGMAWRR